LPTILALFFGLMLGAFVGGVAAVWMVVRWLAGRRLPGGRRGVLDTTARRVIARDDAFFRGDDLLRYPRRLGELQQRLADQHGDALQQAARVDAHHADLADRPDRTELARRYADDAALLRRRADRMARVLGLLWKTRSLLVLRAHVAITARRRPQLSGLPEGELPVERLAAAAAEYDAASQAVRAFVDELDSRRNDLDEVLPRVPDVAELSDEIRAAVDEERTHAVATYAAMRARMDELADTLAYLAERCRTRQVVEGGPAAVDAGPGSEALVDELNDALGALADLAVVGDQRLADSALDNLTEDIGQLEQAGLDAQAETDAVLEVQRLLEQFPKGG